MPEWLSTVPRVELAHLPTPLQPLDRLSEALAGPRVWVKRDDCTGLGTGGNKTRKLEFLLGEAEAQASDTVVTFGAVQSNHARQTAAACAARGLDCHLLLVRKVPWSDRNYETLGNIQLDRLFGAHVHLLETEQLKDGYSNLRAQLDRAGKSTYVIPTGGSNATGALGYAVCASELVAQSEAAGFSLTDIVHATSSAGTQAGLLTGLAESGCLSDTRVLGINVSEPDNDSLRELIGSLTSEALNRIAPEVRLDPQSVRVDPRFLGDGYGLPTQATLEAVQQLASLEGILLDPVYSGKAMGGLIEAIRQGEYASCNDVVFLHTGGVASLPVYGEVLPEIAASG